MALHPECQLVGADSRRHLGIRIERVHLVHALQKVQRATLPIRRDSLRRPKIDYGVRTWPEHSALIHRGQKAGSPAWRATFGCSFRLRHHYVCRQILALAPEPVCYPRAHARISHQDAPGVDLIHRRSVDSALRVKRSHEAHVVHMLRHMWEESGHVPSTLAVLVELPGTL